MGTVTNIPILIVDDEPEVLESFELILNSGGFNNIISCTDGRNMFSILEGNPGISLVLLDLLMPHVSGIDLLQAMQERKPDLPVIVITALDDLQTAVDCMKKGAFDYLTKPVEKVRFLATLRHAIDRVEMRRENKALKKGILNESLLNSSNFSSIITRNQKMLSIFKYAEAIAPSPEPVLITGETGVGKELIAHAIHDASGRAGDFVAMNIAGLNDEHFSDTLFGHRKGAFTGAVIHREGLVSMARNGTLFLDEIGDLEPSSQIKLLRLLQEGEYYPMGSDIPQKTNARVLVATNIDISNNASSNFRRDLFYRLQTHKIELPSLRERKDDLPLLVDHFFKKAGKKLGRKPSGYPKELIPLLNCYNFPGNIRELEAMIFDGVSNHIGRVVSLNSFKERIFGKKENAFQIEKTERHPKLFQTLSTLPTLKEIRESLVIEAMRRSQQNQTIAARLLGISQPALSRWLKAKT